MFTCIQSCLHVYTIKEIPSKVGTPWEGNAFTIVLLCKLHTYNNIIATIEPPSIALSLISCSISNSHKVQT